MVHSVTRKIMKAVASPDLIFAAGRGNCVNILVMGVDVNRDPQGQVTQELGRTDTLVIISLDRHFRTVRGISIPRDVRNADIAQ